MSMSLPHGCHIGKMSVHPANWQEQEASVDIDWMIHFRFHDPNFAQKYPKGKPVQWRGMNDAKTLAERRRITRALLENGKENLLSGYNPILKKIVPVLSNDIRILPHTPVVVALDKAYVLLEDSPTKKEAGKALTHLYKAFRDLQLEMTQVCDIRQHHLEVLLIQVGRNKKEEYARQKKNPVPAKKKRPSRTSKRKREIPDQWGASGFNHYRSYLLMLFKQLKKVGATEVKPVDDIEKKKGAKKRRQGLTSEDLNKINTVVRADYPTFWRFIHIFFHSGARVAEMMGVKKEHVQLQNQRFHVLIKKGNGEQEWVWKTIKKAAMHLWTEVLQEAQPRDYLFSKGLQPGPDRIAPRQVTIRWQWHVKEKLGIEADFYELKHENTTRVINMALAKIDQATKVAADINSHKSNQMNRKVYDLEANERLHRELKDVTAQLG